MAKRTKGNHMATQHDEPDDKAAVAPHPHEAAKHAPPPVKLGKAAVEAMAAKTAQAALDETAGRAKAGEAAKHDAATDAAVKAVKIHTATVSLTGFEARQVAVPAGTRAEMEAFARKAYLDALGVWGPGENPTVQFEPGALPKE